MSLLTGLSQAAKDIGPVVQLAGGVTQGIGVNNQYKAATDVSNYNAAAYDQNARLIQQAAEQNKAQGERTKKSYLSSMRAGYAFRGVDFSGSPLIAMADSASQLELNVQNQEFNSMVEASRTRSMSGLFGMEADNYRQAGKIAMTNSIIKTSNDFSSKY